MHARVGDHIVVKGNRIGEPERHCEVLEVRGRGGEPPYLVRWGEGGGHESLFFPGPDASLEPEEPTAR